MYVDSAYIAKYYVNEPESEEVRALIRGASELCCSALALVEVACVFRRHVLEGSLSEEHGRELTDHFRRQAVEGHGGFERCDVEPGGGAGGGGAGDLDERQASAGDGAEGGAGGQECEYSFVKRPIDWRECFSGRWGFGLAAEQAGIPENWLWF